jgi:vacuolar-type H+-ATPase subunit H
MTPDTQTEPEVIVDATDAAAVPAIPPEIEDILDIVDDLIVHLHEAKTMPLSSNALVDREIFLTKLETLRASLPDELRAARWMVREREAFISRTNEKAREIVDNARTEADALVAESNIVSEAVEEANILVRRAEGDARRLRLEAEDDIERKLQKMEHLLVEMTTRVHDSRAEFHQARPKPPEVPV